MTIKFVNLFIFQDVLYVKYVTSTTGIILRYGDTKITNVANQKVFNAPTVSNISGRDMMLRCMSGIGIRIELWNLMNITKI